MRSFYLLLMGLLMSVQPVSAGTPSAKGGLRIGQDVGKPRPRPIFETGAQAGHAFGVEGPTFSTFRAVMEVGVLFDKLPGGRHAGRALGFTLYSAMGYDDFRIGVKSRLRCTLAPEWSADFSAGALLASLESHPDVSSYGFVGGLSLNYSSWLAFNGDVNVVKIKKRPVYKRGRQIGTEKAGYEIGVYTGVSLRNRAGVYAAVTGAAVFLAYAVIYMAETGGT
jgi:hypothetical protein